MSKKILLPFFFLFLLPQILTEDDFYTILGVSRQATQKEIKKAFRTLSLKYHPDRNPNDKKAHELFLRINKAHEVLTDPDKKRIYDIYGEEGLNKESELMREDLERIKKVINDKINKTEGEKQSSSISKDDDVKITLMNLLKDNSDLFEGIWAIKKIL